MRRLLGGSGGGNSGDGDEMHHDMPPPSPKMSKRRTQAERDRAELQELLSGASHSPSPMVKRKSMPKVPNVNFLQDPDAEDNTTSGASNYSFGSGWSSRSERDLRELRDHMRGHLSVSSYTSNKYDTTQPSVVVTQSKPSLSTTITSSKASNECKPTAENVFDFFPETYKYIDVQHLPKILSGLKTMYDSQDLVDVTLCVENESYPCHRIVLASCSPYFHAMFTHDLTESRQNKIRINGVEAEAMRLIIEYAYTSELEITVDNVQAVMLASNMFQLLNLRDACATYMEKHVTLNNCINIYFFASAHECGKLQELARKLIFEKFTEVCREEEFYNLSKDKIVDVISQDDINVDREEIVYEAVMTWVKRDLEGRKDDLLEVIKHVRFSLLSPYFIHDCMERERLIYSSKPCQQIFEEALQYHLLKDRRPNLKLLSNMNVNTRRGMPFRDMIIILSRNEVSESAIGNDNYRIKTLPDLIEHPECVVMGENQIFAAGKQHLDFSARRMHRRGGGLFQYDLFEKKWLSRAPMAFSRTHFRLAVLDGLIYAVGGVGPDGVLSSVEVYSPQTNSWRFVAPLPNTIKGHCVTATGGQLYVIGGECEETILDTVMCYNPRTDIWSNAANMILPRCSAGVAVFKQELYVVGGTVSLMNDRQSESVLKSVEIYNPINNEWRFGPEIPDGRCSYQVVNYNGALYAMGGENGEEEPENRVWKLECEKKGWVDDQVNWPNITPPYNCVVARILRDA